MNVVDLLPFAFLGAVFGLDVVSFPQAMLSRPIVAATASGALAGSAGSGLLAGAVLEMMAMETLPVGASRYPEWGSAAVVGGALAAAFGPQRAGALIVAVCAAMLTAWVGGWSMYTLRKRNGVLAARLLEELEAGSLPALTQLQLRGLTADLVRGALLTLIALVIWRPLSALVLDHWTLPLLGSHALLTALAGAVAVSATWRLSHGATGARWYFLGGVVLGLAALLLL